MAKGGQGAIRGFQVQTLIALLEALDKGRPWTDVTLEPNVDSEKVDVLWQSPGRTDAVQVKSSENPFGKADVEPGDLLSPADLLGFPMESQSGFAPRKMKHLDISPTDALSHAETQRL